MKVWATFRGYSGTMPAGRKQRKFVDDEWLCDLYLTEGQAREALLRFGEGRPYADPQEMKIVRFYEEGISIFEHGKETEKLENGGYSEWMRYAPIEVREPEAKEVYSI